MAYELIDPVNVLVRWLQELLFLMEVRRLRLASVEVTGLRDTGLSALVEGRVGAEPARERDQGRHQPRPRDPAHRGFLRGCHYL